MPEHHEVADVLLAVKFALGEITGTLALPDLVVELRGSCFQYRASRLGHIDLGFKVVGGHGGWREGGFQQRLALICEAMWRQPDKWAVRAGTRKLAQVRRIFATN